MPQEKYQMDMPLPKFPTEMHVLIAEFAVGQNTAYQVEIGPRV